MTYDSVPDTLKHSLRVGRLMGQPIRELVTRSTEHDHSKTVMPEQTVFDEFTPKLKGSTYGSEEYKGFLAAMKVGLDHHYANNRHHPEFWEPDFEWRPAVGYEGHYEVSNFGDVRSVDRVVSRAGTQGDVRKPGQGLRAQVTAKGYLRVQLTKDGVSRNHMVHRLVALAFIPNPDDRPEVNHKNGKKSDNQLGNLEWSTSSENQIHAYETGLREPATKYVVHCPELDLTTFGCEAMERVLRDRGYQRARSAGIWAAMDRGGKHLDLTFEGTRVEEYRRGRLNGMTLVDLIEMLADWKAATERHDDGSLTKSLTIQKERFGISDQLLQILENTARWFEWLDCGAEHTAPDGTKMRCNFGAHQPHTLHCDGRYEPYDWPNTDTAQPLLGGDSTC